MKQLCKQLFFGLVLLIGCSGVFSTPARAQQPNNRESISSFVQSVAKTVYNLAWPTATYRNVSLRSITPVDSGFDVSVRLSGLSAFDGSDLWVQLVIEIRDGAIHDFRVQGHNAILVPPFATTHALANAAVDMAKAYAAQQAQPAAPTASTEAPETAGQWAAAVCLANTTGADLSFDYQWGDAAWQQAKLASNKQLALWWPYGDGPRSSPQLRIRYDDSFAEGYTERDYNLDRTQAPLPVSCDSATNYKFAMDGATIMLYSTPQH